MIDTKFTDPAKIRELYLNPRNPLQNVDEQSELQTALAVAIQQPVSANQSGGGGGNGGPVLGCPAKGQYVRARVKDSSKKVETKRVEDLKVFADFLYNDILRTFKQIIAIEVIEDVECVEYSSFKGAVSVVSLSHPVIRDFDDANGTPISELIGQPDVSHKTVSVIDGDAYETEIERISSAGKHTVYRISLEGGDIFSCGTHPDKMNAGHNAKSNPGAGGGEIDLGIGTGLI